VLDTQKEESNRERTKRSRLLGSQLIMRNVSEEGVGYKVQCHTIAKARMLPIE